MSYGLLVIATERKRQIDKGYTIEHDFDEHSVSTLMAAAEAYLTDRRERLPWPVVPVAEVWDRMTTAERLAKAGALTAAALDVLTGNGESL